MTLNIVPDPPSEMELVLETLRVLLEKVDRMDRTLTKYEPLLQEASKRLSGPIRLRRRGEV